MRFKIIWSEKAASDIKAIKRFISFDKEGAAIQFINKIKKRVERLRRFPSSGRCLPELNRKNIREILVDRYRVIYRIDNKSIFVLTVFESHKGLDDCK